MKITLFLSLPVFHIKFPIFVNLIFGSGSMNKMSTSSTKSLKRITKKKKETVKKVVNYLISDSYMYSPLLSNGPTDHFSSQNAIVSDTEGMAATKESDKKFGNKVWDYLKTDCYMYAPVVSSTYRQGEEQHHKQAAPPAPEEMRASKTNEPSEQPEKRQVKKRSSPRTKVVRHTVAYRQTVKQMATLNSNSSPESGSGESVEKRRKVTTNAEEQQLMQIVNTSGGRK